MLCFPLHYTEIPWATSYLGLDKAVQILAGVASISAKYGSCSFNVDVRAGEALPNVALPRVWWGREVSINDRHSVIRSMSTILAFQSIQLCNLIHYKV